MSYGNVLAVIPCRRGSKRFPGKNNTLFNGGPTLAQNTIRIAKKAGLEKILVTTDDPDVALAAAAEEVRYLERPEYLCTDDARMEDVVENAVNYVTGWGFDTVCLLQVTSPLLRPMTLQIALDKYFETRATSLTAVNIIYKPAGAFYIVDRDRFMFNKSLYQVYGGVYMLPEYQCIDVDHHYDLAIANAVASGRES